MSKPINFSMLNSNSGGGGSRNKINTGQILLLTTMACCSWCSWLADWLSGGRQLHDASMVTAVIAGSNRDVLPVARWMCRSGRRSTSSRQAPSPTLGSWCWRRRQWPAPRPPSLSTTPSARRTRQPTPYWGHGRTTWGRIAFSSRTSELKTAWSRPQTW